MSILDLIHIRIKEGGEYMKKMLIMAMSVVLMGSMAFAAEKAAAAAAPAEKAIQMEGIIIDNACATANKANLPEFIKTHPKSCALMPNCVKSGYSLYMPDGTLKAFDKTSNVKIEMFLKKKASRLDVMLTVKEKNGELQLITIMNSMKKAAPAKAAAKM